MKKLWVTVVLMACSGSVQAQTWANNCAQDPVHDRIAQAGRIGWATKCGYVSTTLAASMWDGGLYPSFASGRYVVVAPTNDKEACYAGLTVAQICNL